MKKNFYLINRQLQVFDNVKAVGPGLIITGEDGKPLDYGVLMMNDGVFTLLYCDEVLNLTFIVQSPGKADIVTMIFAEEEHYRTVRDEISSKYPNLSRSPQNRKINRYAERIAEKLVDGVEVRVVDAVDEADVIRCPECGVQCAPGQPYCMECGAELK